MLLTAGTDEQFEDCIDEVVAADDGDDEDKADDAVDEEESNVHR